MKHTPLFLVTFRLLLGPAMIYLAAHYGRAHLALITGMLIAGFLSDIFDGIIARRLHVATEKVRRLDSQADIVFWLCAALTVWILWPGVIRENKGALFLLLGLEGTCYLVSMLRFRKGASNHAYSAKVWGLTLLPAFADLLLNGHAGWPFCICLAAGIISYIDSLLILLILPVWRHDTPSTWHAMMIRKGNPGS